MYGPVSGGTLVSISGQDLTCPREHRINVHLISVAKQLTVLNCTREALAMHFDNDDYDNIYDEDDNAITKITLKMIMEL